MPPAAKVNNGSRADSVSGALTLRVAEPEMSTSPPLMKSVPSPSACVPKLKCRVAPGVTSNTPVCVPLVCRFN